VAALVALAAACALLVATPTRADAPLSGRVEAGLYLEVAPAGSTSFGPTAEAVWNFSDAGPAAMVSGAFRVRTIEVPDGTGTYMTLGLAVSPGTPPETLDGILLIGMWLDGANVMDGWEDSCVLAGAIRLSAVNGCLLELPVPPGGQGAELSIAFFAAPGLAAPAPLTFVATLAGQSATSSTPAPELAGEHADATASPTGEVAGVQSTPVPTPGAPAAGTGLASPSGGPRPWLPLAIGAAAALLFVAPAIALRR
jgi:hypothetical protein